MSHVLNQFQRVHAEKSWLWISTTPTAAVLVTIAVRVPVREHVRFCDRVFKVTLALSVLVQSATSTCAQNHLLAVHLVSLWCRPPLLGIAARSTTAVQNHTQRHSCIQAHTP